MADSRQSNTAFSGKETPGMFEGPILKLLVRLSLPIFMGMIANLVYNITDTIWISRIDLADPSYVGGIGMIFPLLFFAMALGHGILVGVSSLVARAIGRRDLETLNRTVESGLAIAVGFSILIMILGWGFGKQMVAFLGATDDYSAHALEYLYFITPAAVLMFLLSVFNGILQGEGLMKQVMQAMVISTVANVALDPVFIFVLGLGIRGAALATCLSIALSLIYVVSVFFRGKTLVKVEWRIRNIDLRVIRDIMAIGFPQIASMVTMSFSFLIFNRVVVSIDQLALTAFALVGRFDQVVLIPIFAIGSALLTMIGQNWGRGQIERVSKIWKVGLLAAVIVVLCLAGVMILLAPFIYPFFTEIDKVVWYAVLQTRIMELAFVFAAVGILARSVFQAMGNPVPALVITVLRLLGIAVPAVYLFVYAFDWGIYGVYLGIITGNTLATVISLIWLPYSIKKASKKRTEHKVEARPD